MRKHKRKDHPLTILNGEWKWFNVIKIIKALMIQTVRNYQDITYLRDLVSSILTVVAWEDLEEGHDYLIKFTKEFPGQPNDPIKASFIWEDGKMWITWVNGHEAFVLYDDVLIYKYI